MLLFCEKCCYNYSSFVPVVHEKVTCQIVICFSKLVSNCHFNDCRMSLFIINFARYETGLALCEALGVNLFIWHRNRLYLRGLAKIFAFCFYNSLSIKYLQNIYKS